MADYVNKLNLSSKSNHIACFSGEQEQRSAFVPCQYRLERGKNMHQKLALTELAEFIPKTTIKHQGKNSRAKVRQIRQNLIKSPKLYLRPLIYGWGGEGR